MTVYTLETPIVSEASIRKLKVNDILYLTGTIVTARDAAHRRALEFLENGKTLPIDFHGLAVFHCGPIVKKKGSEWIVIAAGPTTSARMDPFEDEFIKNFGIRVIIGKGGMSRRTADAMEKFGSVYAAFTGGAGVLAAKGIKKVERVEWLDLGIPEALWVLEVKNLGPMTVAIDTHGSNLFEEVHKKAEESKLRIYEKLRIN